MATPPPFVAEYETVWNTSTSPKTISVSGDVGDMLMVFAVNQGWHSGVDSFSTPSGGGLAFTSLQQSASVGNCTVGVWTCMPGPQQTFTFSLGQVGPSSDQFGYNVLRFTGANGGASSLTQGTGNPSGSLTTTQDNSAVVAFIGDWAGQDGASRAWGTVNGISPTEVTYFRVVSNYTVYGAYWPDVGAAGANSYGLTGTGTQTFTVVAAEVLPTPAGNPSGTSPRVQSVMVPTMQF